MNRLSRLLTTLLAVAPLVLIISVAAHAEVFPVPEIPGYEMPKEQTPAPRADLLEWVDVGVLVLGLAVAAMFGIIVRSRVGLFWLAATMLAYFGFYRGGCVCSIGAIQNVTLAVCDVSYAIPLTVTLFFVLPLIATLFVGRAFCSGVCPLGAMQELVILWPVRLPRWLSHTLGLFRYVYLGLAVVLAATGTMFIICRYDPFIGLMRLGGGFGMLLFGAAMLLLGVFVARPYCRFLCPYGAVLGLLSKVSMRHPTITPDECTTCRLCETACPVDAILEPTVDQTPADRRFGGMRLMIFSALLPVLVIVGGAAGWLLLTTPLAKLHRDVQLAEQLHQQQKALEADAPIPTAQEGTFAADAMEAFERNDAEIQRAIDRGRWITGAASARWWGPMTWGATLFGAWVGLVIGVKLIHMSIRRRRTEYTIDRGACVACGRCFPACPESKAWRGFVEIEPVRE